MKPSLLFSPFSYFSFFLSIFALPFSCLSAANTSDTGYTTTTVSSFEGLKAAIKEATDGVPTTIVLQNNISATDTLSIPSRKKITLDLQNYTYSFDGNTAAIIVRGSLNLIGSGSLENICNSIKASETDKRKDIYTVSQSSLVINGPTIKITSTSYNIVNNGYMLVETGIFKNSGAGGVFNGAKNSTCIIKNAKATFTGQSYTSTTNAKYCLYAEDNTCTFYVLGGTYDGSVISNEYVKEYGGSYSNTNGNKAERCWCTSDTSTGRLILTPYATIDGVAIYEDDVKLTDKKDFTVNAELSLNKITYERSMTSTWGTIFLPFDAESDENICYYTINSIDDSTISLSKTDKLPANTPGIFKFLDPSATGKVSLSADNVTLQPTSTLPSSQKTNATNWNILGTYKSLQFDKPADIYYIAKNTFWQGDNVDGGTLTIPPYRAFLQCTSDAARASTFSLAEVDATTAQTTIVGELPSEELYDLAGRATNHIHKVIMISNGKKVLY